MTKREFIRQVAPLFRVGMMQKVGDDKHKTDTAICIAEDLWEEILKRYPEPRLDD